MKRAFLADVMAMARLRKPGYVEACLAAGKMKRSPDGPVLEFSDGDHARLRAEFAPGKGLGDRLHELFGPIGRAVHWPCLKGDGSTDLKPGSPCARARAWLNKVKV